MHSLSSLPLQQPPLNFVPRRVTSRCTDIFPTQSIRVSNLIARRDLQPFSTQRKPRFMTLGNHGAVNYARLASTSVLVSTVRRSD
jgi:hypothetical protein